MASLVAPLVSGISAAPSGTAEFYSMGTSTLSSLVYSDANGQTAVTTHTLDASGAIVRYVAEPVDVVVKTAAGATVRTFTHIDDARVVRLESPGFTGPSTSGNGQVVAGGRTTEHAAWGLLYESLGEEDGYTTLSGEPTLIQDAVNSIFINIAEYGADPTGVNDSTTAISNAMTAAAAETGAFVFVPTGTYKITAAITIPENVRVFGPPAGPGSSGGATIRQYTNSISGWFTVAVTAAETQIENLTFVADNTAHGGIMISTTGSVLTGRVVIRGCSFGAFVGDNVSAAAGYTVIEGCYFASASETQDYIAVAAGLTASAANCQFVGTGASANFEGASATSVLSLSNCQIYSDTGLSSGQIFDGSGCATMVAGEIEIDAAGTTVIAGNTVTNLVGVRIVEGSGAGTINLSAGTEVHESGCDFTGTTNYCSASLTAGDSAYRDHRVFSQGGSTASHTPNAGNYGTVAYAQSAGAAFVWNNPTIDAPPGSILNLIWYNQSGSNITNTFGTAYAVAAPAITNNNNASAWQFVRCDVGATIKYVCVGPQTVFTP